MTALIPQAGQPALIEAGFPVSVVNGAVATGVAKAVNFCFTPNPDGTAKSIIAQAIPTGTFSALTANLEVSTDGGTTWSAVNAAALDFHATPDQALTVIPGALYRFNILSFTGGTSVVINVVAS